MKEDGNPVGPDGERECGLDTLSKGRLARVVSVSGANRCRLLEMGFTRGAEVRVSRLAAFGGPLEVEVRSYRLSLRRDEAEAIRVRPESAP